MAENFDINLNDEVENFEVEFGEIQRITVDDFDKLRNRPSYDSQLMTHETNIPKVPANVSELNNDSDYQTGEEVAQALEAKQDTLTAGSNIQISEQNVISATDTVYSAGNGINISPQNELSVDTTVVATQQELSNEVHNRENADNYLQGQIDAISASSDVVDIVGTYVDLQNYDTQHLKDNDIIKVLQDETQGNATTYYRWSTSTQTFTLIGQEGPYYTKAGADSQFVPQTRTVNGKALSSNITLDASDVSALGPSSVVQTTGNSTSQIMSQKATTDALGTKLNASDYVVDTQLADSDNPVQNRVLNRLLGNMPSDFFSGETTTTPTASTEVQFGNILSLDDAQLLGNTTQQTYSGKNLWGNISSYSRSTNGIDFVTNADGTITARGTATASAYSVLASNAVSAGVYLALQAGTYTLSEKNGDKVQAVVAESGGAIIADTSTSEVTFTLTQTTNVAIRISIPSGTAITGTLTFYPMLESGSSPTSYEPYTGGIPAPNPGYTQTVNVVTGEQNVWVHGKNILDPTNLTYVYANSPTQIVLSTIPDGIRMVNNGGVNQGRFAVFKSVDLTEYVGKTIKMKAIFGAGGGIRLYRIKSDGTGRISMASTTVSNTEISFNVPQDLGESNYLGYALDNTIGSGNVVDFTNLIMTIDDSIYPYEPYQSATYTVDLGSTELCKIGTYQDKIYKSGDDWYMHKELSGILFNGTENWNYASGSAQPFRYTIADAGQLAENQSVAPDVFSNYYTPYAWNNSASVSYGVTASTNQASLNIICFRNKDIATLADWETWLGTHNTRLYYPIATPTDIKITNATLISELEALLNASTYDGETDFVITATGTNLPAPLQLTAINANAIGLIERMRA